MSVPRLPLPAAMLDPAFLACMAQAAQQPDLVRQFDRLHGADLSLAQPKIAQLIDEGHVRPHVDRTDTVEHDEYARAVDARLEAGDPGAWADVVAHADSPPSA